MKSRWNEIDAQDYVERFTAWGEDIALRTYSSRLIGADPDLVLHGGGNTSVKTTVRDIHREALEVVCVKGSGWDLGDIEPPGLPAVELAPLLRLRRLDALTDEEMVNQLRIRLLDAKAPTPSVETLLHAFLPEKFVDHTHADAILVLTNQPDGEAVVREALGENVIILPWIMPGFPLAKAVADAYDEAPDAEGIVLLKHGIFTCGPDAQASYEKMIDLVDRAERFIAERGGKAAMLQGSAPADAADVAARAMPVLRGALGTGGTRFVGDWRHADDLVAFSGHPDCRSLLELGPLTPDHVIRTKGRYLTLTAEQATDPEKCRAAVAEYGAWYESYFNEHKGRVRLPDGSGPTMLDPLPRVVVVQGAGVFAFGANKKAAAVAADIAEHTLRSKAQAQAIGTYTELSPGELFEMEYWSLEQAKLGKKQAPPLAGQVALITGAGGAIGHGIAQALLDAGAHVMLTDVDDERLAKAESELSGGATLASTRMDVTDEGSVAAAFAACACTFGGVDIVVPNAGVAHVSELADMEADAFRRVVDINLAGTMTVLKHAAHVFGAQGTGGAVVIQASKNVFAPGAAFGAYSASKAGAHQLGKIAALELAPLGVRVNMINADAVFGSEVPSGLWEEVGPDRMRSRGLDEAGLREFYRDRSLLKVEVTPAHVGEAVVFLAGHAGATTGATLTVDGGVPGAFPR